MNVVNLFINNPVNAELDMDNNFDIALQYSIADIRDISKRNAAYSKTVMLPGTKNNNYWLGNLFDINSDFTQFNPNKKTDCKVLVNGEIVIDGFLQLRKINKDVSVDHEGNQIMYECVIYNNFVDLMTELGEKTLYELDLSEFNHVFNQSSLTQSWEHTWEDGYVYPMYGVDGALAPNSENYNIENFWPAPFYKMVFDKILSEAGFGWTGSFTNNAQFEKEIIAFVRDGNVYIDETEANRREFRASVTPTNREDYLGIWPTSAGQIGSGIVVPFNDDFTTPNFDNDNHWDITLYEWTVDRAGQYDLTIKLDVDFVVVNNSGYTVVNVNGSGTTTNYGQGVRFKPRLQIWNGSSWVTLYNFPVIGQQAIGSGSAGSIPGTLYNMPLSIANGASFSMNAQWNPTLTYDLYVNQKLRVVMRIDKVGPSNGSGYSNPTQTAGFYLASLGGGSYGPVSLPCYLRFNNNENRIFNKAWTTEIVQGDTLDLGVFLPDKIKQKDLISDLIKRYNLYIEIDPDNERLLRINERPNYYPPASNTAETLDWTFKKDYSQQDNIELLSELQFKQMLFTWTKDEDIYNKEYETVTGDVYGQYEWTFDNDFVKGVQEVKSPFSPTPLVKTSFGAFVAGIDPVNPKVKPRVLYWGGLKDYGGQWIMSNISQGTGTPTVSTTYNYYPYAGHWDDPIEPTLDIHFGTPKFIFYNEWQQFPTNTMYNTYWSDYIRQIEEGRLVTSFFYLDETDIRQIKDNFNTKIFVKDSYYYVNKIIDYKPLQYTTTQVELIKINDGIKWISEGDGISEPITATACPVDIVARRKGNTWYYVSQSGATVSQYCCELAGGIYQDNGMCRVKKKPFTPVKPVKPYLEKTQLIGSNNTGPGIFIGSNNETSDAVIRYYDSEWILTTGYWVDNNIWVDDETWNDDETTVSEQRYLERRSRSFIYGDNNTSVGNNTFVAAGDDNVVYTDNSGVLFGSNNDLLEGDSVILYGNANTVEGYSNLLLNSNGSTVSGDSSVLINSNSSYVTVSNTTLINVNSATDIQPGRVYLGPSCSVDVETGVAYVGGLVPTGQMGLTYGTKDAPSLTWGDNIVAGLWKVSSAERKFHAGVAGVTVSSWDTKGLDMNNLAITNYYVGYRNTNTSTTLQNSSDEIVKVGSNNQGVTVSLPETYRSGKVFTIKNLNASYSIAVEVGTASHTIDGLDTYITLQRFDSVTLCGISGGWMII